MGTSVKLRYRIEGMDCPACASRIERVLGDLPGVEDVKVTYSTEALALLHDPAQTPITEIEETITALGFQSHASGTAARQHEDHSHSHSHDEEAGIPLWKTAKARLVGLLALAIAAAYAVSFVAPSIESWSFTVAALLGVIPFVRKAATLARMGSPFSIETLMVVASLGALLIGASHEAAIVIFLFALGEMMESVAAGRARSGIRSLVALMPRTALLVQGDTTLEVPADSLRMGQVIAVRPGDRIAADGKIIAGDSSVDEASVTGESTPVQRAAGGEVYAGTINLTGALQVEVTREAGDNTVARIVRLVEEAQESKSPTARIIERFSQWYTPLAMLVAALTIVIPPLALGGDWHTWIYRGLSVLLIACPCALVLSTPAAIASGLAAGARHGLLVKGGAALETIGRVGTVAFDKTGTLTEGRPQVTDVVGLTATQDDVLRLAAAVETTSSHPIAGAIVAEARRRGIASVMAADAVAIGGKAAQGTVEGRKIAAGSPRYAAELGLLDPATSAAIERLDSAGKSIVVVMTGTGVLGVIAARDEPRPDARSAIAELKSLGIRTLMLTGDNRRTGQAIARSLGVEVKAELLPEHKLEEINALRQAGTVAMVGDGINDAPALAASSVGIAMGGGTDVALETADAALVKSRVGGIAELIRLSRATLGNIHQNIAVSIGLKALFLATTLTGTTTMWMAILADTGATVLVTLNALRLLRFRP